LKEDGSNWTFWKTRIVPYLKGSKLWPYTAGTIPKPNTTDTEKLTKWEEVDAQALSTILMNITPNVQAGLDCSSAKAAWDGLTSRYAQVDPIAQNLAQTRLHAKRYMEGGAETLPSHIAELQRLRESCGGLGVAISDAQFAGVITLSMPTPSWDPVIGTLGGILDPKVVISRLNTEWSRRQGLTSINKDSNVVFQASGKSTMKCENCNRTGHTKAKCWAKGGGLEGQYPEWWRGKRDTHTSNTVKTFTDTPIVWTYGYTGRTDIWFADSAATVHVSPNREDFTTYQVYTESRDIKAFGNTRVKGLGEGDIVADLEFQGKVTRIRLTQVMHVPEADGKILSLKVLDQKGFESRICGGRVRIMKNMETYTEAVLGGELYKVKMKIVPPEQNILSAVKRDSPAADLPTWHRRLGHLGESLLKKLVGSKIVRGLEVTNTQLNGICEDCILGKMDEKPFEGKQDRDPLLFGTLHADLMGPMNPEARWSHARFSLVINDDCSGFGFVFNLKHKDDTVKAIVDLDKAIETKFQKRVHTLRTDNGGEFVNTQLQTHCRERGISLITSVAYNPELNGRAERRNRTHIEGTRTMLKDSELGKDLWAEAISTHVYIRNRCPSNILINGITPFEKVFGQAPSIGHLRVFGSKCFIKVPDQTRTKLDDKAKECRLIGYEGESIYVVVDAEKKKIRSRNVIFVEGDAHRRNNDDPPVLEFPNQESAHIEEMAGTEAEAEEKSKRRTRSEVWGTDPVRRSERTTGQDEKVLIMKDKCDSPDIRIPKTYADAIKTPEKARWKKAMDYELAKLEEMNTWTETETADLPCDTQILPGMWVHIVKNLESGDKRFRSRWVVRGDKQKTNLTLSETFAPVSRISSLRTLLAIAMLNDLRIFAWDMDSAYLHGKIDHDLYVDFPDGYGRPGKVAKLNKALYGLPEAARVWHEDLEAKLKELGFAPLGSDTGVFLRKTSVGITAIDTHVDDGTGICSSEEEESRLKDDIRRFYKIKEKDTSKPFKVLGILVTRDTHRGTLKLSQAEYIDSILQRFEMSDCNMVVTPTDKGSHLHEGKNGTYDDEKQYQALMGSLTYAAMSTRPDIGYITQYLSQSNKAPSLQDWNAAKRVLRYLKGTRDLGIVYHRESSSSSRGHEHATPWGYCDANYAEDPRDRKSTSGYSFMLAGGPIAWKSKKQASVALSTTEAEYYALGVACQEAIWLRQLCKELHMDLNQPTPIYSDNTGAVALSDNPVFHNRSKHIDIRWHFIRDQIRSKLICTSHIPGTENGSDFLTKALNRFEHERCVKLLGME